MVSLLLIGLGAGLASALLFASILSGSALAIALFYAAPLPVMIVALGWTHLSGLVAALVGAAVLAAGLSPLVGLVFAAAISLPAWLLSYLVMLGRPKPDGATEWYPIGRVVAAACLLAAAIGAGAVLGIGPSFDDFRAAMTQGVELVLRDQLGIPSGQPVQFPDGTDAQAFIAFMSIVVPPAILVFWIVTTLFNLWLAGRIVRTSGRLTRPWPDLAATRLPRRMAPAFGAALIASFVPGMLGLIGELAAAALATGFMIVGFAAVHDATRGAPARAMILGGLYVICLVMSWALVAVAAFGLADHLFDLRSRWAAKGRPSNDNS
jgi:hypothetical protein